MDLKDVITFLNDFTNEHGGKQEYQHLYRALYHIVLKGRGLNVQGECAKSGEAAALAQVRAGFDRHFAGQTWTIFDVGANTGQFLSKALEIFDGHNCSFYSFEPNAAAFAELQKNHGTKPGVTLVNAGIGDVEEQRTLYSDSPASPLASLYPRRLAHLGWTFKPLGTVPIRTLDQFAAENHVDFIHFLKLDAEGHEFKCLLGAKKLLESRRIACIQFEMGGTNIDSRTFFQDFWYALPKYDIFRILRDGLQQISVYHEGEECFLGQNFLAVLKL